MKEQNIDLEELRQVIRNSSKETAVYVGCDSRVINKTKRGAQAMYVTVVVIHQDGNKGGRIFRDVKVMPDYGQLRLRLMNEVYLASGIATEIIEDVGKRPFELHLDLNPDSNHKSSVAVKEATGYVMAMLGIKPKLKPEAFTASAVADHYT